MSNLPKVIATSVIRSSNKGESHGGLYLVDLESAELTQLIDWNKMDINWEGRGMDRGMRGIAFYKDHTYVAISDEILIYDNNFILVGSIKNDYLLHCHEIFIEKDKLYLTSTGFDAILEYDLIKNTFSAGYCLRFNPIKGFFHKLNYKKKLDLILLRLTPKLQPFDPNQKNGPVPGDSLHLNNVFAKDGCIYVSGRWLGKIFKIMDNKLMPYASIPYLTHNARPYKDGIIVNNTEKNKISFLDRKNVEIEGFHIPRFEENRLLNAELPDKHARQGFGRGLCCHQNYIIAGSSPATISVYRHGNPDPLKSVTITLDIRNAIHGLAVLNGAHNKSCG